jgi:tRNA uridine 5-carboxymethylaminomethyl modification enzyme
VAVRAVVLTSGTFLRATRHHRASHPAGRARRRSPGYRIGRRSRPTRVPTIRLKTGTPPRIDARSVDFVASEPQHGHPTPVWFGHYYVDQSGWLPDDDGLPPVVAPDSLQWIHGAPKRPLPHTPHRVIGDRNYPAIKSIPHPNFMT